MKIQSPKNCIPEKLQGTHWEGGRGDCGCGCDPCLDFDIRVKLSSAFELVRKAQGRRRKNEGRRTAKEVGQTNDGSTNINLSI